VNFTLFLNAYGDAKTGPVSGLQDAGNKKFDYYPETVIGWLKTMAQPGTTALSVFRQETAREETRPVLEFFGPRIIGRADDFAGPVVFDCVIENLGINISLVDSNTQATLRAEVAVSLKEFAVSDKGAGR